MNLQLQAGFMYGLKFANLNLCYLFLIHHPVNLYRTHSCTTTGVPSCCYWSQATSSLKNENTLEFVLKYGDLNQKLSPQLTTTKGCHMVSHILVKIDLISVLIQSIAHNLFQEVYCPCQLKFNYDKSWGVWLLCWISHFQTHTKDRYLKYFLLLVSCPQVNIPKPHL